MQVRNLIKILFVCYYSSNLAGVIDINDGSEKKERVHDDMLKIMDFNASIQKTEAFSNNTNAENVSWISIQTTIYRLKVIHVFLCLT